MASSRILKLSSQGEIQFFEASANGRNRVSLKAPALLADDLTLELPGVLPAEGTGVLLLSSAGVLSTLADGAAGQVLATDGDGNLAFVDQAGGAESLQEAYDGGNAIDLADNTPITLSQSDGGGCLALTNSGGGTAFSISNSGAGLSLYVDDGIAFLGSGTLNSDVTDAVGSNPALVLARDSSFGLVNLANGNDTSGAVFAGFKTRGVGTAASTPVQEDDALLNLVGYGADGIDYQPAAKLAIEVDGPVIAGTVPGRLVFSTVKAGTDSLNTDALLFYTLEDLTDFFENAPDLTASGTPVQFDANLGKGYAFGSYLGSGAQAHLRKQDTIFDLNGNTRTFAVWFYATSFASSPPIFGNWQTTAGNPVQYLCWVDSGALKWQVRDGGGGDHVCSVSAPSLNEWHLAICTYDSGTGAIVLYLDDSSSDTDNAPSVASGTNTEIGIGTRNNNGAILSGAVSAFGMWTRLLTPAERTLLWNAGDGIEPPFATSSSFTERFQIDNQGRVTFTMADDLNLLTIKKTGSGVGSCLVFENDGVGHDLEGNDENWYVNPDGSASFLSLTSDNWSVDDDGDAVFNSIEAGTITGTVTGGATIWAPDDTIRVIASGVITIDQGATLFVVDTQDGDPSDNLDTINGGVDGQIIVLKAANSSRTIAVRHAVDNVRLPNGNDRGLDHVDDRIMLQYNAGDTTWVAIASVNNHA